MTFDLTNDLDKARFKQRCNFLYTREKVVVLTEKRLPKSPNQNRYLHLIMGWVGFELGYTTEQVKQDILKRIVCREIFVVQKNGFEVCRSLAELDKAETTTVIDQFRNFASIEMGIYLPEPGEEALIRDMERELSRKGIAEFL